MSYMRILDLMRADVKRSVEMVWGDAWSLSVGRMLRMRRRAAIGTREK